MTEHIACIVCPGPKPRRALVGYACGKHFDKLGSVLSEIGTLYARLPSLLLPGSPGDSEGQVHGKRDAGPLPTRADVLNMLGPASAEWAWTPEGRVGPIPALPLLQSWLRLTWEERNFSSRTEGKTMPSVIEHLQRQLEFICGRSWLDEFANDLARTLRALQRACGEHVPQPVGTCPVPVMADGRRPAEDEVAERDCGTWLWWSAYMDKVRCKGCGAEWDQDHLDWMAQTMGVIAS